LTICDSTPKNTAIEANSIQADLLRGKEKAKAKEDHFQGVAEKHTKKPSPTDLVKVRFLKEYRTQIPRPGVPNAYDDKIYPISDVAELQRWKAEDLLKRCIVELAA
jgi:hypothetical protein